MGPRIEGAQYDSFTAITEIFVVKSPLWGVQRLLNIL